MAFPLFNTLVLEPGCIGGLFWRIGGLSCFGAIAKLTRSDEFLDTTSALNWSVSRKGTLLRDFCRRIPSTKPKVVLTNTFSVRRPSEENQLEDAGAPVSLNTSLKCNCLYSSQNSLADSAEQNIAGLPQHRLEFSAYHVFFASSEGENTRCKRRSFAPPSLVFFLLILWQMTCRLKRPLYIFKNLAPRS